METHFGPPSEPIDVQAFIQSAQTLEPTNLVPAADAWLALSPEQQCSVLAESSVADLRQSLFDVWNNPRISAYLFKAHEQSLVSLDSVAKRPKKKHKAELAPELVTLQKDLESIKLDSWTWHPSSTPFIRTSRNSDYNTLKHVKLSKSSGTSSQPQAVVIATVYEKVAWNPNIITRISQHALLSSQTLGQLYDMFPCTSKEMPQEIVREGKVVGYECTGVASGCVICIEGHAYGDGKSSFDYAEQIEMVPQNSQAIMKAPTSMYETTFESLPLRLNEPYWLLHAGNCEHFIVLEQIRLKHSSDPVDGYPLTLQMTPVLLDLCRSCRKIPAVWSIVNDVRLGESPCLMCESCRRNLGGSGEEGVIMVPLPPHKVGWVQEGSLSIMTTPISPSELLSSLQEYDNVLAWVNDNLGVDHESNQTEKADLIDLDQRLTLLTASLDIAYEDTSSQLERVIDEVSRSIPRLTYDLHFMKDTAVSLKPILGELVRKSREAVPDRASDALSQLRLLDNVKTRMEAVRNVLKEAENWSTLEVEVTSFLAERSYIKAAERLSEANKSIIVFQNTPEYDPRRTLLVNLQNQLEASLSSALVSAIKAQDVNACRDYYTIFSTISRDSEFRNYYYASRRTAILTMWQDAVPSDIITNVSAEPHSLGDFLSKFYSAFSSLLNLERVSIPAIFPDPAVTLSTFITTTLSTLQPTMSYRLAALSSHHGDFAIQPLIFALQATEAFAADVSKMMEKMRYTPGAFAPQKTQSPDQAEFQPRHTRRRSSRMSISWRNRPPPGASAADIPLPVSIAELEWDQELFQPFLEFQVEYGTLERRFLANSLKKLLNSEKDPIFNVDCARLLREQAIDVFSIAEGSLSRCGAFTYGYGSIGLVQALDSLLNSFLDDWTMHVQTGKVFTSSSAPSSISQEDFLDLEYTVHDWSSFQTLIHLLASGHAFYERFCQFEAKLRTKLAEFSSRFRSARSDPANLLIATTKGESQLLEQSLLNSAELQELLDSIESEPLHSASLRSMNHQNHILKQAFQAILNFAKECQAALEQVILSPLKGYLMNYSSLPIWSTLDDQKSKRSTSALHDLQIPTFSLSQSETVQRVSEGLLNLPRLFEIYADDDALSFSLNTLPFVDSDDSKMIFEQSDPTTMHRRRPSVASTKQLLDPEVVSSAWLFSLGKGLLNYITSDVLPHIPVLSSAGAAQLVSDLDYLSNIVRALNVESEELERWRQGVGMNDEEGRKAFTQNPNDSVMQHIGRMRGWDKL
ncbi:hypothetical protein AMATHDRAFT_45270 [Amanita thiersii Skay4041]|uniref:Conserved oligomeric Golgi complex subunit 7 n=1 Tax=Amanita thiersii Skay4041 TaxID=703135 RepID=A0A2A9P087_9AGAR|nr:hypothetical protein AMATHDRAFT_45270 [Amanita thiersii Skay4041]